MILANLFSEEGTVGASIQFYLDIEWSVYRTACCAVCLD